MLSMNQDLGVVHERNRRGRFRKALQSSARSWSMSSMVFRLLASGFVGKDFQG